MLDLRGGCLPPIVERTVIRGQWRTAADVASARCGRRRWIWRLAHLYCDGSPPILLPTTYYNNHEPTQRQREYVGAGVDLRAVSLGKTPLSFRDDESCGESGVFAWQTLGLGGYNAMMCTGWSVEKGALDGET